MIRGIDQNSNLVITEDMLPNFLAAMKAESPSINKYLFKSLLWQMTNEKLALNEENKAKLISFVDPCKDHEDQSLKKAAREILKICKGS